MRIWGLIASTAQTSRANKECKQRWIIIFLVLDRSRVFHTTPIMVIVTYVYTGEAYWRETRRAEEGEMAEVTSKIRSFYDAGIPFYTKEALRDVSRQLERLSEKGQKVSVRGLDGSMVDFEIESGLILPAGEPDLEMVLYVHHVARGPKTDD